LGYCSLLIPFLGDKAFQDFAFVVDSPPKVMPFTIDLHEHLVQMPPPSTRTHALNASLSDFARKNRPKSMPLVPGGFVAHIDAAFVQQILDVPVSQKRSYNAPIRFHTVNHAHKLKSMGPDPNQ
jgi:hypothetical protein